MNTIMLIGLFLANLFVTGVQSIGICNGNNGNNLPTDQELVQLCQANGISKLRLYIPKIETLEALKGTGFTLILDAPNVQELSDPSVATQWVQSYVLPYWPGIRFQYIAVGNEIDPLSNAAQYVHPAMVNIYNALVTAGLGQSIKISTSAAQTILGVSYPPSQGAFSAAALTFLDPILKFLNDTTSQLLVNVYPYYSYTGNSDTVSLPYALFTSQEVVVTDDGYGYTNIFDATMDSLYAALEKVGLPNMRIIVSETGWPSDGGLGASVENAGTYYKNLMDHTRSGNNTPRKPGIAIDAYLFAMFDENLKPGSETERHWGIFTPDKQQKYNLTKIQKYNLTNFS